MSEKDAKSGSEVAVRVDHTPTKLSFGPSNEIDLAGLDEEQRKQMLADYNKGILDVSKTAHEMKVDLDALHATLSHLGNATSQAAKDGTSVTITHTQDTNIGRTEIIMGNTDEAQRGKLSRSQTGETNWTPYYIFGGLVALVIIVAAFAGA
ncbi:hypothetical protein [Ruegeria arenilitoris]|uniref:hypothetical protein n=1 Tax=Ruegeria arenilitoris TaxID=1173585 RepID=UPI00147DAD8D|nr:hypothetical protein [Ruegeria arenilitoris]